MPSFLPTIAITAGDPCGIGPEVILKALAQRSSSQARLIVIGDLAVFERTARRLHRRLPLWRVVHPPDVANRGRLSSLTFLECGPRGAFPPGKVSARSGRASLAYLEGAVALWRAGRIDGLVTAPVTKWAIARIKPGFAGHTEYLARAMGVREVVMMFVSERLRVALMSRHLPLKSVSRAITPSLVRTTLRLTHEVLRRSFKIAQPRLAMCGLNPHAGEEARCGQEERSILRPMLRRLRREGIRCDGPFAADGFFASGQRYDAVICAYHDQGLIPFKMLARDHGCQLSVGLPLVRTSPDHGSALDIAGRGVANPGSMIYALQLATTLACSPSQS